MKHKSILRELAKLGVEVKNTTRESVNPNVKLWTHYTAEASTGRVAEWHGPSSDNGDVSVRVRRVDDLDDLMSDYHAGFYIRTVKSLKSALDLDKPSPQPTPEDSNRMSEQEKEDLFDNPNWVGSRMHY